MKNPSLIFVTFQCNNEIEFSSMIRSVYETGIIGFDTSPSYQTEEMLGDALTFLMKKENIKRDAFFLQDKIDGWQMELSKGNIAPFVEESLGKLKTDYLDVLFVHWPFQEYLNETWMTMNKLKEKGVIRHIGLSNVRVRHLDKIKNETGILPDFIQIERHPLRTCQDEIDYCKGHAIVLEAYSPLCRMDERLLKSNVLKAISEKYEKNIGQVILRWHIDTGVVPVFMSKKKKRIEENCNLFDFSLTNEEILEINKLNMNFKIFVESVCCPGI